MNNDLSPHIKALGERLDGLKAPRSEGIVPIPIRTLELMLEKAQQCEQTDARAAKQLVDKIELKLEKLSEKKQHAASNNSPQVSALQSLNKLTQQLFNKEFSRSSQSDSQSIDDFLLEQEQEMLSHLMDDEEHQKNDQDNDFSGMHSIRYFRESWVKANSERLVANAIENAPKDAGPLNSHKLAIRSLMAMRDLSPEYLNRFVSYIETLLWLEKAGERLPKPKSTGR